MLAQISTNPQMVTIAAAAGGALLLASNYWPQIKAKLSSFFPQKSKESATPHDHVEFLVNYFVENKDTEGVLLATTVGQHLYKRMNEAKTKQAGSKK